MNEKQVEIAIQRIYTRDLSFESPRAPQIFGSNVQPQIGLNLSTNHNKLDDNTFEVLLNVTATAEDKEGPIFIAEVEQAGIFSVRGIAGEELGRVLGAYCPGILFPYVREIIDGLTTKGSFPPLMLAPVNFEHLYQQQRQQQSEQPQT